MGSRLSRVPHLIPGFGLIEAVLALAIISIAALGYIKAQLATMKNISDTMARTAASILIEDMSGRMQANAAELWVGNTSAYLSSGAQSVSSNCYSTTGSICTSSRMAKNDLAEWRELITNAFPAAMNAVGYVCLDATPGTTSLTPVGCGAACGASCNAPTPGSRLTYTVKIFWKSSQGSGIDNVAVGIVEAPLLEAPTYPPANTH